MDTRTTTLVRLMPALIAASVVLADRITKIYIQHTVNTYDSISVVPRLFRIVHSENPGAAFGMLADGNPILRAVVLIGVSTVVLIFVATALWSRASTFTAGSTRFSLALILGGAVGNLWDRVLHGTVTDFLEVYHGTWSFPAFNVADSAITVGAVFLMIELARPHRKQMSRHVPEAH